MLIAVVYVLVFIIKKKKQTLYISGSQPVGYNSLLDPEGLFSGSRSQALSYSVLKTYYILTFLELSIYSVK